MVFRCAQNGYGSKTESRVRPFFRVPTGAAVSPRVRGYAPYAFARPASTLPAQNLFRARLVVLVWIRKHVFESYRLNRSGARTSAPSVRFLRSALLASQKAPLGSTSALAAVPSRGHQLHVTRRRPRTVAPVSARARRARNVGCGSLVLTGPGIGTVNMGDRVHKNTRPGRVSNNIF